MFGGIAVIALLIIGALGYYFWGQSGNKNSALLSNPILVDINGDSFAPGTITVQKNQPIIWTNADDAEHGISFDQEVVQKFDSEDALKKGESYSFAFEDSGTFTYHDPLNPVGIKGVVVVQ